KEQLFDYNRVLDTFRLSADLDRESQGKYEVEIIYLKYFTQPDWAISQYKGVYIRAANQPALRVILRRLVRAFDDFRKDRLFTESSDELIHEAIRSTTFPWSDAPVDRIRKITSILNKGTVDPFNLIMTDELLSALIKKRDLDVAITIAKELQSAA